MSDTEQWARHLTPQSEGDIIKETGIQTNLAGLLESSIGKFKGIEKHCKCTYCKNYILLKVTLSKNGKNKKEPILGTQSFSRCRFL